MCGVIGVMANSPVNQLIYDALLLLQHRGQDAAGMTTNQGQRFCMHKGKGKVISYHICCTNDVRAGETLCRKPLP